MLITKIIIGSVSQQYDTEKRIFIGQSFFAGDSSRWVDGKMNDVPPPLEGGGVAYLPMDMIQPDNTVDIELIMKNIREALEEMPGEDVAEAYNKICDKQICYIEDSAWEYGDKQNREEGNICPKCGANLGKAESVRREYVGWGHYVGEGDFEPDGYVAFPEGRFDLASDSDQCVACGQQL